MKTKALAAAFAAVALGFAASSANAVAPTDVTYSFSGQCSDCTGTGAASLTLADYAPGTALSAANFVSFSYAGTDLVAPLDLTIPLFLSGELGSAPGFYNVSLTAIDPAAGVYIFNSTDTGLWSLGRPTPLDQGTLGTWNNATSSVSAAPEPLTWALLMAGVGAIGLVFRHAKRKHGFRFADAFTV